MLLIWYWVCLYLRHIASLYLSLQNNHSRTLWYITVYLRYLVWIVNTFMICHKQQRHIQHARMDSRWEINWTMSPSPYLHECYIVNDLWINSQNYVHGTLPLFVCHTWMIYDLYKRFCFRRNNMICYVVIALQLYIHHIVLQTW